MNLKSLPLNVELSKLPSLPLEHRRDLPNRPAIYFVMEGENILYIGQTANLGQRWQSHHTWSYLIKVGSDVRIAWLECQDKELLRKIETALIEQFEPKLNGKPGETAKLTILLPEDTRARFKSACALHRKSMNEILVDFIDDFLKQNERSVKTEDKGAA